MYNIYTVTLHALELEKKKKKKACMWKKILLSKLANDG